MHDKKIIPTFDFYKTLNTDLRFVFSHLEESYNTYDASLPHRHNYYEILLFNGNGGLHEIDFVPYPIQENSLHFVSPEQVHLLRREKHVTGFVISFTREFFISDAVGTSFIDTFPFFNNPYSIPVVKLNKEAQLKVVETIKSMKVEHASVNTDKAEALFYYLCILLITARRLYSKETIEAHTHTRHELTFKFKKLVDVNFLQHKTVAAYASLLHISAGHLNDTVQKDMGKTASEIIYGRIVLEAKRLLYHSPKSVKEIAVYLNYDDPSYFTRFFKTHTQFTPEEFRKHIREKYR